MQKLYFSTQFDDLYFSQYPNNLFIKGLACGMSKFISYTPFPELFQTFSQNIFPESNIAKNLDNQSASEYLNYFFAIFINCILVNASVFLSAIIAKKKLGYKSAFITFMVALVFVGLSPWICVPYSDTPAMFVITLLVYAHSCIKNTALKWSLITIFAIIGLNIKPTICFVLVCIIFIEFVKFVSNAK